MFPELAFGVVACAALLAFNSWRSTLLLCTIVAILQDPMRKLTPGQPVYFVGLVGVVFAAGWIGAFVARVPLRSRAVRGWRKNVGAPFTLLVAVVLLQALHSLDLFGSPVMTAIGVLSYLSAVPAVIFAYQYAVRFGMAGISRWMWTYVVVASVTLLSVYLEYIGIGWTTLGQVGEGMIIYDVGRALKAYSGFFRAAEIAAWHSVTIACCLVILLFGKRRSLPGLVAASGLIIGLVAIGTLTGRRKLLVEIAVFASVYFGLFALFQKNARKLAGAIGVAGLASYLLIVGLVDSDSGERKYDSHRMTVASDAVYEAYTLRSQSVFEDVGDRVATFGFAPITWAYDQWGFFGAGVGAGSQGTQHYVGDMINRGAAEGGLGKIMLELGVPGLVLIAWLSYAILHYVNQTLNYVAAKSAAHARLGYGLVAFLAANAAAFAVATQAYGDVFILLCLGWSAGFLLALPVLAERSTSARAPALTHRVSRVRIAEETPCVESTAG
jgi:hypothetical protein